MTRRAVIGVLPLAAAAALVAAPVGAKEGVKATLTTRIPLKAAPGTRLHVGWRLFTVTPNGNRQPFGANGVFVRLLGRSGGRTQAFAPTGSHGDGRYAATVKVPRGGIRDVQIGLWSIVSGPKGTHEGAMIFPITNDPVPD